MNLASHQSGSITEPAGSYAFSIDHEGDWLSGNDMSGIVAALSTAEKVTGPFPGHVLQSFVNDVSAFAQAFAQNKGDSKKLLNDFVTKMKNLYGITVIIVQ